MGGQLPDAWSGVIDGFHGEEVNRSGEVVHKGARHLALRDGMWMQPEPLLYLGLTNGNLRSPVGYTGVYAAGDSNALADFTGLEPFTLAAVKHGAAVLDLSPEMQQIVADTVRAVQKQGPTGKVEVGAALSWSGQGGTIAPAEALHELGSGGGRIANTGAGFIHDHPGGVTLATAGFSVEDQTAGEASAALSGGAVAISAMADGSVKMLTYATNCKGEVFSTGSYELNSAGDAFVATNNAGPPPRAQCDVKGSSIKPIEITPPPSKEGAE